MLCMRCAAALLCVCARAAAQLVQLVDTRIGTGGAAYADGALNPGATQPFGALRLGPDTTFVLDGLQLWLDFEHFGGYKFNDTHVRAFSHTHCVGAGITDWGNMGVTMVRSLTAGLIANSTSASAYASAFRHSTEVAQPGLYSVQLDTPGVLAELTASGSHTGAHRYTCQPSAAAGAGACTLLVDVCHTTSLPGACKAANVTVAQLAPPPGTNNTVIAISASVLNGGGLTGRGPLGGVWVHFYGEVTVVSGPAAPSPAEYGLWSENVLHPAVAAGGPSTAVRGELDNLGAWATLGAVPAGAPAPLVAVLRVGLSFVDHLHARGNLYADQAPSGQWNASFDGLVSAAQSVWESWLGRTAVQAVVPSSLDPFPVAKVFAAASYRALLAPTTYSEWDGAYMGMDGAVHSLVGKSAAAMLADGRERDAGTPAPPLLRYMSDMSLWDVHRSQMPWLNLVAPDVANDVIRSLLTMAAQGGHLPRWPMANVYTNCMSGSHGLAVLAEGLLKCVPGVGSLVDAIFNTTLKTIETQAHSNRYAALGYIPSEDSNSAASDTLEFAFDDGVATLIAQAAGQSNWSSVWVARSKSYGNVWDAGSQCVCPRSASGSFSCPYKWTPYPIDSGYTEGDGGQWQWAVGHDLQGLFANCWGGNASAYSGALHAVLAAQTAWPFTVNRVSDVLPNAFYWAGNEPSILIPWQFVVAGPTYSWLTQFWTRWVLRYYFVDSPDGLPGNDDYGTMSSWAAWATLGLYPLAGTDAFVLGSPSVLSATIALPTTHTAFTFSASAYAPQLQIVVHNATGADGTPNRYVASASANGVPLPTAMVRAAALTPQRVAACSSAGGGGVSAAPGAGLLEFYMSPVPTEWGTERVLTPAELAPFPLPAWPTGLPGADAAVVTEGKPVGTPRELMQMLERVQQETGMDAAAGLRRVK